MIKDHIIDLLDSELYEQLIEELQNNKIDKELFYKVVILKFKEWQFHIIENLLFLNLISEGFVRKLIMKNDNLGASMYMIKEMSNVEDIILNMDNLISKNLKNIHSYNIAIGILRTIILDEKVNFDSKLSVMELYIKYADYENLCICLAKLENSNIDEEELNILLEIIANRLNEIQVPDSIKSEDIENVISFYSDKSVRKLEL